MTRSRTVLISLALLASAAFGSAVNAADAVVLNDAAARLAPSVNPRLLRPFVNPLPAPAAAANARAEARPVGPAPGAMVGNSRVGVPSGRAFGSFGIPYNAGRVAHGATSLNSNVGLGFLSSTFPYRAVGLLNFSAGYCSASLIRRSVIVTAAHCIQNFGSGAGGRFTGFTFTPAYFGNGFSSAQIAPYGTFSFKGLVVPNTWVIGTDPGTGSARANDLAVLALNKNAGGQFIGDLTGYLDYAWNNYSFVSSAKTGNLAVAETTTLGYPGLLDAGQIMQFANGPSFLTTVGAAPQIWQGSTFTAGSSGGPWVVNFHAWNPANSGGASAGAFIARAVVGVTSWGSSDPNQPKDNYSSQFGQNTVYPAANYGGYGAGNIASLLNTLCNAQAGGGQTFAQAGYC